MEKRTICFLILLFLLFTAESQECQQIQLTWSTVSWHIHHDPYLNLETLVPLPSFTENPMSSGAQCNIKSVILDCEGCSQYVCLDTKLKALRILAQSPPVMQFQGKIKATWPDRQPAAIDLPFYVDVVDAQNNIFEQEDFLKSSNTAFQPKEQTVPGQLQFSSKFNGRRLQTTSTTSWYPTSTTINLLETSGVATSYSYTIGSGTKTQLVNYYCTISPTSFSSKFTVSYTVTQADGSALPSWMTWTNSGTQFTFSISTTDNSKHGTYSIMITATAKSNNRLVQLKSTATDMWLTVYGATNLKVDVATADRSASTWELRYASGSTTNWNLLSCSINLWLCAECGGGCDPSANRVAASQLAISWETFVPISLGDDLYYIKVRDGQFLGIDGTSTSNLKASALTASTNQEWYLNDVSPATMTQTATFDMVMIIGCYSTAYDAFPSTKVTTVVYLLGNSITVTQPFVSDSVNNAYGTSTTSSICGTTSVTLTESGYSQPYCTASTTLGYPVLTIYTTSTTYVGTRSLTIKYYLTSWTSIYASFSMTIYICNLVAPTTSTISYTIFSTKFFSVSYFTMTPTSQSSKFTITYQVTKSDDTALPSWLTFVDSGTDLDFTAKSTSASDKGTYTIKISATSITSDGQSLTSSVSFTLTASDPCTSTQFNSISGETTNFVYYLGGVYSLSQPWVNDSVNKLYGSSTTSSICGTITVTADDPSCNYNDEPASGNSDSYTPQVIFETVNSQWVGTHSVLVRYSLTSYPTISTSFWMTVTIARLVAPTSISSKSYTVYNTALTFSSSYFTISPNAYSSQFDIDYSVTKSDGTAKPTWLTFTDSGTDIDFSIYSNSLSDKGTYTISLTASATKTSDGQSGSLSTTFTVVINDPCLTTTYKSTTSSTKTAVYYLASTKTIAQPFVSDSINDLYGSSTTSSICGTTAVTLKDSGSTPSYVTVSTSSGYPDLTFSTSSSSLVGTRTLTVTYNLASYTTITTSYTMTVYICQLVAPTAISQKSYTIYKTALTFSSSYFTITPSSQSSQFTITYTVSQSDGSTSPTWLTMVNSGTDLDFTVFSSTNSDEGTYTILITATATLSDGTSGSLSTTFTIVLKDGCTETIYDSTNSLTSSVVYYLGNIKTVTQPFLSDSANNIGGSSTTSSICGTTSVTLKDSGSTPSYVTVSTSSGYPVLTFSTSSSSLVGTRTLTVTYYLTSYTTITKSYTMTVYICQLVAPSITSKQYIIFNTVLTYSVSYFTIAPSSQSSQFTFAHAVTKSDGELIPSWLSVVDSGTDLDFTAQSTTYTDAGTYSIKITATATLNDSQIGTFSTTYTIVLTDPCQTTTYVNDGTATSSAAILLGTTQVVTYPYFSDTVNNLYGTGTSPSICYTTTASVTESGSNPAYVSVVSSASTPVFTFTTSTPSLVGSHSITIKYTLNRYSTITLSLPMTVYISQLVAPTAIATQEYTLFDTALTFSVSYFTISPSSSSQEYILTHVVKKSDGSSLPSWLTLLDSESSFNFSVYSNTYTDSGTYSFTITATAKMSDGQYNTLTQTFTVKITDKCSITEFVYQNIPDLHQFIGIEVKAFTVSLPILTDTVNQMYGTDPLNSICYTQSITISEGSFTSLSYLKLSQNADLVYQVQIQETDKFLSGSHVLNVLYKLNRYTSVTTTIFPIVNLYRIVVPTQLDPITYSINDRKKSFSFEMFTTVPSNGEITFTYVVNKAGATSLPQFLTFAANQMVQKLEFTVYSSNNGDVGTYNILINATATHTNLQSQSASAQFTLFVQATIQDFNVNSGPKFSKPLQDPLYTVAGDPLIYQLPPIVSPKNLKYSIRVDIGATFPFLKFEKETFEISAQTTTDANVGSYPLKIVVEDTEGFTLVSKITLYVRAAPKVDVQKNSYDEAIQFLSSVDLDQSGYSFKDQFIKARQNAKTKSDLTPIAPNVTISQISAGGVVTLTFTKNMYELPVERLRNISLNFIQGSSSSSGRLLASKPQNLTIKCVPVNRIPNYHSNGRFINDSCAPAYPKLIPGYYSEESDLNFTYEIVSYKKRQLKLKIKWENPLLISKNFKDPDYLEIHFYGNYLFFDTDGLFIEQHAVVRRVIPRQIADDGFAQAMLENGGYVTAATQAFMAANFIMNLLLSASLNYLWAMINTQQIILMLPLFCISLPGNAAIFFNFIMQIASFDIIPTDLFYNDVLGWSPNDPINQNFEDEGFGSTLFIYNIGSMIIAILLYPVLVTVYLILRCCCTEKKGKERWYEKTKERLHISLAQPVVSKIGFILMWISLYPIYLFLSCCCSNRGAWKETLKEKLRKKLFWTHPIVTMTESFTVVSMCVLLNFQFIDWDSWTESVIYVKISNIMTIMFLIIIVCMPIVLGIILLVNFKRMNEPSFEHKFGAVYENIDTNAGRLVILEPITFLVRRLALCAVVIYTDSMVYQFLVIIATCVWQVKLVTTVKPYKTTFHHHMEILNEVLIMLVVYTFMLFSDFVQNVEMQFNLGYFACGFVTLHLVMNIGLIGWHSIKNCREKCKEKRLKQIHAQRVQDALVVKLRLRKNQVQQRIAEEKAKKVQPNPLEAIKDVVTQQEESNDDEKDSEVKLIEKDNDSASTIRGDEKTQFIRHSAMEIEQPVQQKEAVFKGLNWDLQLLGNLAKEHENQNDEIFNSEPQEQPGLKEEPAVEPLSKLKQRVRRIIVPAEPLERLKLDVTPEMIDDVFGFKPQNSTLAQEPITSFKLKKKTFSGTSKFV